MKSTLILGQIDLVKLDSLEWV